jgi:hypothetical protein
LYFQTLDEKTECVGVYVDGELHFDKVPEGLTRTWRYTGSITDKDIEYAWLYTNGATLGVICPEHLFERWDTAQKKFRAFMKTFEIGRINLREHCFFDMVPETFLKEFCEVRNQITEYVFDNFSKPENYDMLNEFQKLLHKIKFQDLNVNMDECKHLFYNTVDRRKSNQLLKGSGYIDYNLFGTVTGRLTTNQKSFPVLTMKKDFRKLLKPKNDWFLSLDYNGAEVRTFLDLSGIEQPECDVHQWNIENVFKDTIDRDRAKTNFFSWLYNPESDAISSDIYKREKVLDKWYDGRYIRTPFKRKISVTARKALNYLIQSTTSDRVLLRATEIDKLLENKKSFISHIVHDELVVDFHDSERDLIPSVKEVFEKDNFKANINVGKNYLDFEELKL